MNATNKLPVAAAPDLTTLVATVLGHLAYLLADEEAAQVAASSDGLAAEIRYDGATSGRLRCWCTRGLAEMLAANLLALEPHTDAARSAAEDALAEFMNVLCGQLVTSWHDRSGVYNLSIPKAWAGCAPPAWLDGAAPQICRLSVEGELLVCAYEREP